jgi:hypothetical protein
MPFMIHLEFYIGLTFMSGGTFLKYGVKPNGGLLAMSFRVEM